MSTDRDLIPLALHYAAGEAKKYRLAQQEMRGQLFQARSKGATDEQIDDAVGGTVPDWRRILGDPMPETVGRAEVVAAIKAARPDEIRNEIDLIVRTALRVVANELGIDLDAELAKEKQ